MADLERLVEASIRCHRLLEDGQGVLVAVSGGLDSIVLLHVLARLGPRHGWRLGVVHFDHGLRGPASRDDRMFVKAQARKLGLPAYTGRAPGGVRPGPGESLEMAARTARHRFFARVAAARQVRVVALGHHADDQVELFFLRLLRGASPSGLGGMRRSSPSPVRPDLQLVRPLLDLPRAALEEFARREGLAHREDATNQSPVHLRNRIRHHLLPWLRRHYQAGLTGVVAQTMELLRTEADYVGNAVAAWQPAPGSDPFGELPVALQRRVLEQGLLRAGQAPEYTLIEALRSHPAGFRANLDAAHHVQRDGAGRVEIRPFRPSGPAPAPRTQPATLHLAGQGRGVDFGGLRLRWRFQARPPGPVRIAPRPGVEVFDAERVGPTIQLRHWRPGDRFQPSGMTAAVKLQDLFVNARIPREERRQRVVAQTPDGRIVWVEGLRIGEQFKLDKATRRTLKWTWQRV